MTGPADSPAAHRPLGVALLGAGTVGSQVARLLVEQRGELTHRTGAPLDLVGVAVRRPQVARTLPVPADLVTTDAAGLVGRDDVDVVVEVIGGIEPAKSLLLAALKSGKSVVTANKALLAEDGAALFAAAREADADLYFEAAVAGGIPLLRAMRESLAGDRITRVLGIVNGTCNFVLSRMVETGASFGDALAEATALGYAEADPTADVEGYDAASKAAILAGIAFHTRVTGADVYREGITGVTADDIASATATDRVVKLLAIAERAPARPGDGTPGGISVRVHPAMIPSTHPLAAVRGAFNAVYVEAEAAGQLMFYGPGAGGAPTASAVLGDLVAVARNRLAGGRGPGELTYAELPIRPMGDAMTRYHVIVEVADRVGVLASIANAFARHAVSIQTLRQEGHGADATLTLVTHTSTESALAGTVAELRRLDTVRAVVGIVRVEGEGEA